jgi:hypothetical protein
MKTLLVAVISLALVATSAHARIGETVKQVEARYGKPQKIFIDRPDLRKVGYGYRGFMAWSTSAVASASVRVLDSPVCHVSRATRLLTFLR